MFYKTKTLPSDRNKDHKTYWKLNESEPPCTLNFIEVLQSNLEPKDNIEYAKECSEGHELAFDQPEDYPDGEFQLEAVIRKGTV